MTNTCRDIQTLTQVEHFLLRPEVYMGIGIDRTSKLLLRNGKLLSVNLTIDNKYLHVFKEVVANAIDATDTGKIDINVSVEDLSKGDFDYKLVKFSVFNTGTFMLPRDLVRCFFEFLTGSNFGTEIGGIGRNGIGAKVVPLVASHFKVVSYNPDCTATLEVRDYAVHKVVPQTTTVMGPNEFTGTRVEWEILVSTIHCAANVDSYETCALEFAMGKKLDITFNGTLIPQLWERIPQYLGLTNYQYVEESHMKYYIFDHLDKPDLQSFSIINGLYAPSSGYHHNKYTKDFADALREKFKNIAGSLTNDTVRAKFIFLYNFVDPNIKQNGQEKSKVLSMSIPLQPVVVPKTIAHWPSITNIQTVVRKTKLAAVKKVSDFENTQYVPPTTTKREILLIGEGDSTRGYLNRMRELYGVTTTGLYVLKGKPRNCIEAEVETVAGSKTILGLMSALGITLLSDDGILYNKIIIAADADDDGLHIVTLVYTIFVEFWPNLLNRIYILGSYVTRGYTNGIITSRHLVETDDHSPGEELRYFKGLGSCNNAEIEDDFMRAPLYKIRCTPVEIATFKQVMRTSGTNARKNVALSDGCPLFETPRTPSTIDTATDELPMYVLWSYYYRTYIRRSIVRSIPSIGDGIKDSLRKILYTVLVQKHQSYKVDVLANSASQLCDYHHGAKSLCDAIVRLCRNFHTQVPMLTGQGQFGTIAGNDGAASRYLAVSIPGYLRTLFPFKCTDQSRLVSILPYPMINGMTGIASGWQTNIPKVYLPSLIKNIKEFLKDDAHQFVYHIDTHYKGTYEVSGGGITITEPPWGQTFANVKTRLDAEQIWSSTIEGGRLFVSGVMQRDTIEKILTEPVGKNFVFHNDSSIRTLSAELYGKIHAQDTLAEFAKLDAAEREQNAKDIEKVEHMIKYCVLSNGIKFGSNNDLVSFCNTHSIPHSHVKHITDLDKTSEGLERLNNKLSILKKTFPSPKERYTMALDTFVAQVSILPDWQNLKTLV